MRKMMSIEFLPLLLFFFIKFAQAGGNGAIPWIGVIKLADCHKHFDYYRKLSKEDIWEVVKNGQLQMDHYLRPQYQIQVEIDECLAKTAPEVSVLRERIFHRIGINKWLDGQKARLAEAYEMIGKKELANFDGKMETMMLSDWRRMLMPLGLATKIFYLTFASGLLQLLFDSFHGNHSVKIPQKTMENLRYMKGRMEMEIEGNHAKLMHSSYMHHYMEKDFFENYNKMVEELKKDLEGKVSIIHHTDDDGWQNAKFDLPKVKRVIWVIRHSERFDQTLCRDCKNRNKQKEYIWFEGKKYGLDNSPLSVYGREIADRLEPIFKQIPITRIYASAYVRTLDTADRLLGAPNVHHKLEIKLEEGFLESMKAKRWNDVSKLTYQQCEAINEGKQFKNRMDCKYASKVTREELAYEVNGYPGMPKEVIECDDSLLPRVEKALRGILNEEEQRNDGAAHASSSQHKSEMRHHQHGEHNMVANGEENAAHIVIVTHASVVVALQQLFDGKYSPVPPASITKLVDIEYENDGAKPADILSNIRMVYAAVTSHLGQIDDPNFYQ